VTNQKNNPERNSKMLEVITRKTSPSIACHIFASSLAMKESQPIGALCVLNINHRGAWS